MSSQLEKLEEEIISLKEKNKELLILNRRFKLLAQKYVFSDNIDQGIYCGSCGHDDICYFCSFCGECDKESDYIDPEVKENFTDEDKENGRCICCGNDRLAGPCFWDWMKEISK